MKDQKEFLLELQKHQGESYLSVSLTDFDGCILLDKKQCEDLKKGIDRLWPSEKVKIKHDRLENDILSIVRDSMQIEDGFTVPEIRKIILSIRKELKISVNTVRDAVDRMVLDELLVCVNPGKRRNKRYVVKDKKK